MVEAWDGWCPTTDAKQNIKFVVPKEGSDLWVDTMVIMKSSKNKEAAHAFINYILDPEVAPLGGGEHQLQGAQQGRHGQGRDRPRDRCSAHQAGPAAQR